MICVLLSLAFAVSCNAIASFEMKLQPFASVEDARRHTAGKIDRLAAAMGSNATSINLRGSLFPLGIYAIEMSVGTPPQPFRAAVDTGSCTLVASGANCRGCAPHAKRYSPKASSTSMSVKCRQSSACEYTTQCVIDGDAQCKFSNTYETCNVEHPTLPCTISGPVYEDLFHLGPLSAHSRIAVIEDQTAHFDQLDVVDGILGVACRESFGLPTPLFALAQTMSNFSPIISFCFATPYHGRFMIGDLPPSTTYSGEMKWMALGDNSMYTLPMVAMNVGSHKLPIPPSAFSNGGQGTILDSGSALLYMPTPIVNQIAAGFATECAGKPCASQAANFFAGKCFNVTSSELAAFPSIELEFTPVNSNDDNIVLTMPPDVIFVRVPAKQNQLCVGIVDTGANGFAIIGDTTMFPYTVTLDRVNNRAGWAPVNTNGCSVV